MGTSGGASRSSCLDAPSTRSETATRAFRLSLRWTGGRRRPACPCPSPPVEARPGRLYSVCGWQSVTHAVKRVPRSACPGTVCIPRSGGVAVRRAALCTGARRPHPRDPDRAPNRMCVRRVCARRRPAARRSKSRYPGQQRAVVGTMSRARAARSGRGYLYGLYARGRNGRDACNGRVAGRGTWADSGCDGRASVGGGYGGLSPIPDSGYRKKKFHTQPHCASRRTTLFSPPVGMMSRVRRQPPPDAPRLVLKCL